MSTQIAEINNTGRYNDATLDFTQFYGGDKIGTMLQLTQGAGLTSDTPSFIQLSLIDAYKVIIELSKWIKQTTTDRAEVLQAEIDKNVALKKTIFKDAVDCHKFIMDLEILAIPIKLLS